MAGSSVGHWLASIGLAEFGPAFHSAGYTQISTLAGMPPQDVDEMLAACIPPGKLGCKVRVKQALQEMAAGACPHPYPAPGTHGGVACFHNNAMSSAAVATAPVLAARQCAFCSARPAYQGLPYCSEACSQTASAAGWTRDGQRPPPPPQQHHAAAAAAFPRPTGQLGPPPAGRAPTVSPVAMCAHCLRKPAYPGYSFCGKACAAAAAQAAAATYPPAAYMAPVAAGVGFAGQPAVPVVHPFAWPHSVATVAPQLTAATCTFCKAKPARSGHPFCSKACAAAAAQAAAARVSTVPAPAAGICPWCKQKALHPGHPYCSKYCGNQASARGWVHGVAPKQTALAPPPPGMCQHCRTAAAHPGHPYCSKTCSQRAAAAKAGTPASPTVTLCLNCNAKPPIATHNFCCKGCAVAFKKRQTIGGTWQAQPQDMGNGVKMYSLVHGGTSAAQTLDATHYAIAQTQYNQLLQGQARTVTRVDYYENPAVKQQYDACVQSFTSAGKDAQPIWIFRECGALTRVPCLPFRPAALLRQPPN
jgi:Fe-S-cluster-containing dehydrogenase component